MVNGDENRMQRLQRMIRPFILRRLKGEVLRDLPAKLEENVFAKLEGEQLALYDAHVQRMKESLEANPRRNSAREDPDSCGTDETAADLL